MFTCIDCMTVFYGDEYMKHTQCISEAQKYQGNLYDPSADNKIKKGAVKQDDWVPLRGKVGFRWALLSQAALIWVLKIYS